MQEAEIIGTQDWPKLAAELERLLRVLDDERLKQDVRAGMAVSYPDRK